MSDFDPVVLFSILQESLDTLFWPVLGGAAVLGLAVVAAAVRAAGRGRFGRTLLHGAVAGVVVAAVAFVLVPAWTQADLASLGGVTDVVLALLFALAPGAVAAAVVFVASGFAGHRPA
jgi:hypothetical protein